MKQVLTRVRNFAPTLDFTFWLKGGLNHVTSILLLFVFLLFFVASGSNLSLNLYPHFCRASLNMGAAFSNSSSLHDVEEILLLIAEEVFYYVWGVVA